MLHVHEPPAHVPLVQLFPHVPQSFVLVWRSTQPSVQWLGAVCGQEHWPEMHVPLAQLYPHVPQSVVLVAVFTHPSGHCTSFEGHVQTLFAQVPFVQLPAHVPQ